VRQRRIPRDVGDIPKQGLEILANFQAVIETRRMIDPSLIIFREDAVKTFNSLSKGLSDSRALHDLPYLFSFL
jgi:hypothetical protein